MRRALLFLFFAMLLLLYPQGGTASGETFASVDLYIYGDPDGQLQIDEPSTSNSESVVIGDGEQSAGNTQEVGRWTTSSLYASANISGDWSGKAWISTNRDATVTLTYTLIQNDENLDSFQFEGDVGSGETVALGGESDFTLTGIDDSPLTLLIESTWTAQPGSTPPPPPENTTITLEYGASSRDTSVSISISHVQISEGNPSNHNAGQSQVTVYLHVSDVFGVDDILGKTAGYYNMRMAPEGESPWSSTVDKVTDRGDYVEVQFIWSYEGHTLPAGENSYTLEAGATDLLSEIEWSINLQISIFIEPKPDIEIDPVSSVSKTAELGKSAIYTLSVENTGSGSDEFIVTYDNNDDGWTIDIDLYVLELDAGDSENIKVTVTPSNTASDGQESPTQITVTAASYSDIYDTLTLLTTAEEPEPDWDFSVGVGKDENENYDFSCGCFVISDRAEIEITIILTNEGNQQNNYNLEAILDESPNAFSLDFNPGFVSSLPSGQSINLILTLKPRDDYSGQSTYLVVEATSSGDGRKEESEPISIVLEQSGNMDISITSPLKAPQGGTITYSFQISNTNMEEAKRIYFAVSGDNLAEGWITFEDKDGKSIAYPGSLLTLLPSQSVEVTLRISIPSSADIGSYNLKIWMANDLNLRISDQADLDFVATQAVVTEKSDYLLYGVLVLILGGVLVYGYRNFSSDDGFEDEYDDELEAIPELIQTPVVPEVKPVEAPPPVAAEIPTVVAAQPEIAAPVSKPRKKWFGLFGRSEPEVSPENTEIPAAVVQPVVAEPVVAQPVVAQPVIAEPVVAQPVIAEPVVAQPVVAEPVVAQPVVAQPVIAEPVVVIAEPVVAQPVVAQPVVAEPVVVQPIVIQPVEEDEE